MADIRVNPVLATDAGIAPTYTEPTTTDTYKVVNNGRMVLYVKKTGAGACDVTVVTPNNVGGLAIADRVVSVPATTGERIIGPFPPTLYNDGNQDLSVTFSEITGLSFVAVQL